MLRGESMPATCSGLRQGLMDPICPRAKAQQSPPRAWVQFYKKRAVLPPGSCSVDLQDVVVGGGQHQDLLCVAMVEHLSGTEGLQTRHGHTLLLLVTAAHRVHAAPAADAGCVPLVVQRLVQQGQTVVLHAAV